MSYPPPPPPGQGGPGPNDPYQGGPYQGGPYQPNPYGASPYGAPPKKDTTLWWILGVIAVVVILCCIGVCGFFGWAANEASKEIDSMSSSSGAQAGSAQVVSEGSEVSDNGATVRSGWRVISSDDLAGVTMRNDGSSREMLRVTFFFMENGELVGTARCSSSFLEPGETDYSPDCRDGSIVGGHDEIRFSEGS